MAQWNSENWEDLYKETFAFFEIEAEINLSGNSATSITIRLPILNSSKNIWSPIARIPSL